MFENRRLTVAVPDGYGYNFSKDDLGLINVQLAAPKEKVTLHLLFIPDPDGEFGRARTRKEKMVELFQEFVDSSVEKAMQFEELDPRTGAGSYCVFTDAKLAGKTDFPPGEYLHFTAGLKAWPGVLAIFRLFSNDTTSPEYQAVIKLLRESVQERPVPLR
ncbi:MAG: hypothetical protein EXS37_16875 [Opitutus sp.]|nr:hypothetical protein [Opitutus sp.]